MAKSNVKITTLDMRGWTNSNHLIPTNKWEKINQLMKQRKIGILVIQEAHLSETHKNNLEMQYKSIIHKAWT